MRVLRFDTQFQIYLLQLDSKKVVETKLVQELEMEEMEITEGGFCNYAQYGCEVTHAVTTIHTAEFYTSGREIGSNRFDILCSYCASPQNKVIVWPPNSLDNIVCYRPQL